MIESSTLFTNKGWVKTSEIEDHHTILQFNPVDYSCSFVKPKIELIPFEGDLHCIGGGARKSGHIFMTKDTNVLTMELNPSRSIKQCRVIPSDLTKTNLKGLGLIQAGFAIGEINTTQDYEKLYIALELFGKLDNGEWIIEDAPTAFMKSVISSLQNYNLEFTAHESRKVKVKIKKEEADKIDFTQLSYDNRSYEWALETFHFMVDVAGVKRAKNVTHSIITHNPRFADYVISVCTLAGKRIELESKTEKISQINGIVRRYQINIFKVACGSLVHVPQRPVGFSGNLAKVTTDTGYYFVRYSNQICVMSKLVI